MISCAAEWSDEHVSSAPVQFGECEGKEGGGERKQEREGWEGSWEGD